MIYSYLLFDKPFNKSVVIRFILSARVIQVNLCRKDTKFNTVYVPNWTFNTQCPQKKRGTDAFININTLFQACNFQNKLNKRNANHKNM